MGRRRIIGAPDFLEDTHVVRFAHILSPTDLSELSVRPVTYAAALARLYKASLTILHVVPTFEPVPMRSSAIGGAVQTVYPVSREEVLAALERTTQTAGTASTDLSLVAEAGNPPAMILEQAVSIPADLVVMGTHGRSGFERAMMGSVAEKVLRKAPCPVLLVPPHTTEDPPADVRFKNILCPMDFSPAALQALGFALDLAKQTNGSVTVLHIIEWLTEHEPSPYAGFDIAGYRQHLIDDAHQQLQALDSGPPDKEGPIRNVVALGRPHRQILRTAAESKPDLIVMGAQGRGGISLTLFGSTTQQVVREAPCPVLTVRGAENV